MRQKHKFTMDDYWTRLEEVRNRHKPKPATDLLSRVRQAVTNQSKPRLPKV